VKKIELLAILKYVQLLGSKVKRSESYEEQHHSLLSLHLLVKNKETRKQVKIGRI